MNKVDPTGTQDQSAFYIAMEKDAREEGKSLPEFIAEADQRAHLPEIGALLLPVERAATAIGKVAARALGLEVAATRTLSFASGALRNSHFAKHSGEFGFKTAAAYERAAGNFLGGKAGKGVLEGTRKSGDIVRYNPKTNEFGVLSKDGKIRTYFKPDTAQHGLKTNLDYYKREVAR